MANFFVEGEPTLSSLFDKLAQLSGYIWYVNPTTLEINFAPPGLIAAPFTLEQSNPLWEAMDIISDEHDFRDRQYVSIDFSKFAESCEEFTGDGVSTTFTLRNPVHSVNSAFITRNTQNTAIGTMSGQPNPGDTVTIGYPTSGSIYNWAPNSPYAVGYQIIDGANHIQQVISVSGISPSGSSFGQSGGAQPTWNDGGGTTFDSGLVWQDEGLLGFGPSIASTYTFVATLDNTQYGQVLIGATAADTLQNLVDAINSTTATRGIGYSLPTWENSLCNADAPSGSSFTVRNKEPGQGYIASLAATGTAFTWNFSLISGGITTFNTISINVGVQSPGARTTSLSYLPGLGHGQSRLATQHGHESGSQLLSARREPDRRRKHAAGRAARRDRGQHRKVSGSRVRHRCRRSPEQALADAQAALTAFEVIPTTFEFITLCPGLQVGMSLDVGFSMPDGPDIREG